MRVPRKLGETQKWFGTMIAQPLQEDSRISSLTPFGTEVQQEAKKYIKPSPTLAPHQRIEIYHQQYWWRLLNVLHENFPMVTRLFGHKAFNQKIAIPYLSQNPPTHWGLCQLGQTLPQWLQKNYQENDRDLVTSSAEIDASAQRAFWTASLEPLDFTSLSEKEALSQPIALQPHIHLFKLKGDLFSLRDALLKQEVEYFNDHPFPEIDYHVGYFVLYRDLKNRVSWKKISYGAYQFLTHLKKELTLAATCKKIERLGKALKEAQEQLPLWLREWTYLQWFSKKGHK